jgi:hypothetical protein
LIIALIPTLIVARLEALFSALVRPLLWPSLCARLRWTFSTVATTLLILPPIAPAITTVVATRFIATIATVAVATIGSVPETILVLVRILFPVPAELAILARLAVVTPVATILAIPVGTLLRVLAVWRPSVIAAPLVIILSGLGNISAATGIEARALVAGRIHLVAAVVVALVLVVSAFRANTLRLTVRTFSRLLQLLAIGHDDAIVVFCMLEIVFGENGVARRLCIARKRQIFLRNMSRSTADLYIGSVRLEAARQRVLLMFAVPVVGMIAAIAIAIIIMPAATAAILLSLPHCL